MLPITAQTINAFPGLGVTRPHYHGLAIFCSNVKNWCIFNFVPLLGARWVPLQVRLTMGVMLTMVIWQYTTPVSIEVLTSYKSIIIIFCEIAIRFLLA